MVSAGIICMLLGCIIAGAVQGLVLRRRTPQVVQVREGSTLVLQAYVESEEDNLWFYGPGNRLIGEFNQMVDITREESVMQLHIWRVDRHQSGVYTLKGFDVWSNERLNWSVIVQVVPEYHVTLDSAPTCCVTVENPEPSCVKWEFDGCEVVIRNSYSKLLKEYNQCGELTKLKSEERERLLLEAAETEDISKVKTLLMMGTEVNYNLAPQGSPLCAASRKGNVEMSLLLLNTGASLSRVYGERYRSPYKPIEIVPFYMSPIHCAAFSGSIPLVQILLDRGANIRDKDGLGRTPFIYAAMSGSVSLIEYFLSWGADNLSIMDFLEHKPIHFAAWSGSHSVVQYLIDLGADPLATDSYRNTPLFYAALSGSVELVQLLVSLGSDPLSINVFKETPIVYAAYSGYFNVVEVFLKWGANILSKNLHELSLLHIAARNGHLPLVQKLIDESLNATARDDTGATPLHLAAREGHLPVVQALINAGARASIIDDYNHTALYCAKFYNRTEVIEFLSRLNT